MPTESLSPHLDHGLVQVARRRHRLARGAIGSSRFRRRIGVEGTRVTRRSPLTELWASPPTSMCTLERRGSVAAPGRRRVAARLLRDDTGFPAERVVGHLDNRADPAVLSSKEAVGMRLHPSDRQAADARLLGPKSSH